MSDFSASGFDHSQTNVFGGFDAFDGSGQLQMQSMPNAFGGLDYHGTDGSFAHSMPNVFGGQDYFAGGQPTMSTMPGAMGMNVMDAHGQMAGTFSSVGTDLSFQDMSGQHATWHQNAFGGYNADPLNNMASVQFPSLLG